MGVLDRFRRKNKETLTEASNTANYEVAGIDSYNFIRGLRLISSDMYNTDYILDRMMDDAIISTAVDMYIDDTLQIDPQKQESFWVEIDMPSDNEEKELAKGLAEELNAFLKEELRMNKEIRQIIRRLIIYGSCQVRIDFIDKLEDDRLCLIDKNEKTFESIVTEISENIFKETLTEDYTRAVSELRENATFRLDQASEQKLNESIKKVLKNKKLLKEDMLNKKSETVLRLLRGRWSAELIGQGTNIWELSAKGKTIAYLDVRKPNYLIKPDNIVNFSNYSGKYNLTFEVGPYDESTSNKDYFTLKRGQSYLENSIVAWQVLSALEDILMLTRMTRSTLYRIFSVEVGNKGDLATKQILNDLKNKIKMDETINVKDRIYNSDLRQIPLGDSIFIPTRNGIGNIDIKVVGGDINLKDAIDLDYFKDKLFASLRIPKAFLGFSEDSGGLINTSLTRMDIRYARTIKGIQSILAEGLKDLCLKYLAYTRQDLVIDELPDFKIVFASINVEEDNQRCETKQLQVETLGKIIETFSALGIEVGETPLLRDRLIKEWLGSDYYETVKEAEETLQLGTSDDENAGGLGGGPSFSGGPSLGSSEPDFTGGPDLGGEEETEIDLDTEEIGAGDTDFDTNENPEPPSGLSREL